MDERTQTGMVQKSDRLRLPERFFLVSQADNPAEIRKALLDSAVSDGWISLLVNVNTAIFVGLIALTAEFGAVESLIFLAVQLTLTFIGMVTLLFLQIRQQSNRSVSAPLSVWLLTLTDILLMCGWGFGVLLFAAPLDYLRSLLVITLITSAGIVGSALNARLLPALIFGRIVLFTPSIAYYANEQPPFWGLLICTLLFATAVSIGIGYAIYVQHLTEANLGVKLRETSVLLEQQSFALERSMLLEQEAQEKLLKETRLREHFLHSVSHDLNQPLSALAMYLNGLIATNLPGVARKAVGAAQQCLSSARALVNSVAQLVWITDNLPPPTFAPVELATLLKSAADEVAPLAAEKGLKFRLVQSSLTIQADPEFLERIIRNLLHNAVQYTFQGGIVLGVRRRAGGEAEITVADSGAGISEAEQELIFDAFYQVDSRKSREVGNVGLGLRIVSDLATALGGRVRLTSKPGVGSIFGVVLRRIGTAGQTHSAEPLAVIAGSGADATRACGRVLLAEDNADYSDTIGDMLEGFGYRVAKASTPAEIDRVDGAALAGNDFIVLDFDLGNGVTAFDLLDRGKGQQLPPCLIISQFDDPNMILHVKRIGGRFLKKPFDASALETTLRVLAKAASVR